MNPNPALINLANGAAIAVGMQASLISGFGFGAFASTTPSVVDLGSFVQPGILSGVFSATPAGTISLALYGARQACH
jgi:hypothetical protein